MKLQGNLHKMHAELSQPVRYQLKLGGQTVTLNELLGQQVRLEYLRQIECVHCGRVTNKSFNQGFCYPCFRDLARCDICIVSPEKCHFHLGTCREPEWAEANCMRPHVIYLSNTSGVKVGVTRATQIPTRWIDQGAVQALPILEVSQRFHAGLIEDAFKHYLNDKTNWRTMLKNEFTLTDLFQIYETYWPQVKPSLDESLAADAREIATPESTVHLEFPAHQYPSKISSFNFDKNPVVEGRLDAIKGQYLIFDTGVINIRKYGGYLVSLEY